MEVSYIEIRGLNFYAVEKSIQYFLLKQGTICNENFAQIISMVKRDLQFKDLFAELNSSDHYQNHGKVFPSPSSILVENVLNLYLNIRCKSILRNINEKNTKKIRQKFTKLILFQNQ